jgi:hypothetical protein
MIIGCLAGRLPDQPGMATVTGLRSDPCRRREYPALPARFEAVRASALRPTLPHRYSRSSAGMGRFLLGRETPASVRTAPLSRLRPSVAGRQLSAMSVHTDRGSVPSTVNAGGHCPRALARVMHRSETHATAHRPNCHCPSKKLSIARRTVYAFRHVGT